MCDMLDAFAALLGYIVMATALIFGIAVGTIKLVDKIANCL